MEGHQMRRKGYLKCGKVDCGKRGYIRKRYRSHVQLPMKNKLVTITDALEYNAKNFYKQHQYITYFSPSEKQEARFDIDEYHKILPFTPHDRDYIIDFEKRWKEILSKDLELRYPIRRSNLSKSLFLPQDYTNNNIHKFSREISINQISPRLNRISIFCLFCSISFSSLHEIIKELDQDFYSELLSSDSILDFEEYCQRIAKCLILPYSYIESIFDNKYHISDYNILRLIRDTRKHKVRGASTRNAKNWLICVKCLENGHLSWIVDKKCSECKGPSKITKLDPQTVERIYCNTFNDIRFLCIHYPLLVKFWSKIIHSLKNDLEIREKYMSTFAKYENQLIDPRSKYLINYDYLMVHTNSTKPYKKVTHILSELDMLNTQVIDAKYISDLTFFHLKGPGSFINQTMDLLNGYGFPNDVVMAKLAIDLYQTPRIIKEFNTICEKGDNL